MKKAAIAFWTEDTLGLPDEELTARIRRAKERHHLRPGDPTYLCILVAEQTRREVRVEGTPEENFQEVQRRRYLEYAGIRHQRAQEAADGLRAAQAQDHARAQADAVEDSTGPRSGS